MKPEEFSSRAINEQIAQRQDSLTKILRPLILIAQGKTKGNIYFNEAMKLSDGRYQLMGLFKYSEGKFLNKKTYELFAVSYKFPIQDPGSTPWLNGAIQITFLNEEKNSFKTEDPLWVELFRHSAQLEPQLKKELATQVEINFMRKMDLANAA